MSLFTDTITIYNKHTTAGQFTGGLPPVEKIAWSRTVIKNTMWKENVHYAADNGKGFIEKTVSITIPLSEIITDKQYLKPSEFRNDPENAWTVQIEDIVVYGECDKEISDQYPITRLRSEYKSALIKQVADSSEQDVLPMWELECV